MANREIKVVISAEDDYSAKLRKFNAALGEAGLGANNLGGSTDKLTREFNKFGNANELAAGGLRRFQSLLSGMAFGGTIGIVSALTGEIINYYKELVVTEDMTKKLSTAVMDQAKAWKILPEPMGAVTSAQIALFNAQLKYAQFLERDNGQALKNHVKTLEQVKRTWQESPEFAGFLGNSLEQIDVKLEEATLKLNQWQALMDTQPTTLEKMQGNLEKTTKTVKELKEELGAAPSGTNFLTAFIGGSLSGPTAQKVELAGLSLGETFVSAVQWGIEKKKAGLEVGDLTFEMEPDYQPSLERFFAYSDAVFARQEELDNALLDKHITTSDQMIGTEKKLQQTKMNLQFAAGNNAVALLSILGGKHKEFALVALAAQKGLAMAQVFISGKAAAAAALVPPPIGLGPVFGAPLAASIEMWSYINMGLIAATGLAEGLMKGGGSPSGIGGGGGVGALPIQSPDLTPLSSEREAQSAINITLIVNTLDGADVNWAKIMEDNIAPALENYSGDGNRPLNITVSQRN